MTAAVLALQGAFAEHKQMLSQIGIDCVEIRKKADLKPDYDGIILPGGESTVQGKLLGELDMLDMLRDKIKDGVPTLATCAGLILLAEKIEGSSLAYLKTLPVTVTRNAYGRQTGSFYIMGEITGIPEKFPMNFIRAPYVSHMEKGVDKLAEVDGRVVAVKYKNQLAMAFHPELSSDARVHRIFADMMKK